MWSFRYYWPLLGFVVPTAVIGYGFVIPSSCIAGINELSVGFGTTILGAAMTYVAGIRSATRVPGVCTAPPLRVRFARYINRQASSPSGAFGRLLGMIWSFEHRNVNRKTLELLDVTSHDDVLEIGCGPGNALHDVAAVAANGHVLGLDVSRTMVAVASRRNRSAIERGRVVVRLIDGAALELAPASFDRAFAVHSLYFWKVPEQVLAQLASALRPGGRLVLAFRPEDASIPTRFREPTYRFHATSDVTAMLTRAGFTDVREHRSGGGPVSWVVAHRAV